jgi:hypothetical protein
LLLYVPHKEGAAFLYHTQRNTKIIIIELKQQQQEEEEQVNRHNRVEEPQKLAHRLIKLVQTGLFNDVSNC